MLVRPGFEPTASHSADRRSPNLANRGADTVVAAVDVVTIVTVVTLSPLSLLSPLSPLSLGTFSTNGFQDGYGELDREGLGIQGAVCTKARENKNSLATKTIPDYGVNEIVGETRT